MPKLKSGTDKVPQTKVKNEDKIKCYMCGDIVTEVNYYNSFSPLCKFTGKSHICKKCTLELYQYYLNKYNDIKTAIYYSCRKMDYYFNSSLVGVAEQQCKEKSSNIFGSYITKINSLSQYKYKSFDDSLPYVIATDISNQNSLDLIEKFGENYYVIQLGKLEKFYKDMCDSYDISTPSHKQLLKFICKLNLKMDKCLEDNDTIGFAKLAPQYETMTKSAKFRPLDKVSADTRTGIRTFSQIFEEVEKHGFINPTPIEEHQDIVDKTIMYILNYTRKLVGVQKLSSPPIDTPKIDEDSIVDINNIEVDTTLDIEEKVGDVE